MRVNMTCQKCGGKIEPNWEKIKIVAGGSTLVALMGLLLATPTGWLAVASGLLAGSRNAQTIARLKTMLYVESGKAGGYFRCFRCPRDVGVGELFSGEPPALTR